MLAYREEIRSRRRERGRSGCRGCLHNVNRRWTGDYKNGSIFNIQRTRNDCRGLAETGEETCESIIHPCGHAAVPVGDAHLGRDNLPNFPLPTMPARKRCGGEHEEPLSWWLPPDKPAICTDGPIQTQRGNGLAPLIHRANRPGKLTGAHPTLGHPWFVVSVPHHPEVWLGGLLSIPVPHIPWSPRFGWLRKKSTRWSMG
jgi:hypothetical protein